MTVTAQDVARSVDGGRFGRAAWRDSAGSGAHQPSARLRHRRDVIEIHDRENRLCELLDGTLLEKTVGNYESYLAGVLIQLLGDFVRQNGLGIVMPPDGMMRLAPGLVRLPDVSFISWERLPGRKIPHEEIWDLAPDLAVEVISRGNTRQEMARKLADYFAAGVRLVWYVYPAACEVQVYEAPDKCVTLGREETLDGGQVLPGFRLSLAASLRPAGVGQTMAIIDQDREHLRLLSIFQYVYGGISALSGCFPSSTWQLASLSCAGPWKADRVPRGRRARGMVLHRIRLPLHRVGMGFCDCRDRRGQISCTAHPVHFLPRHCRHRMLVCASWYRTGCLHDRRVGPSLGESALRERFSTRWRQWFLALCILGRGTEKKREPNPRYRLARRE